MRSPRTTVAFAGLVACALLLAAPAPSGATEPLALLDHVPADTPYAYVMLEPMPEELAKRVLALAGDGWDAASRMAEKAAAAEPELRRFAKVVRLLGVEIEGAQGSEALARLGLSAKGRIVIYGVGAMPVLRMELLDGAALRGVIDRATAVAEVTLPMRKHKGVAYWHIEHEGSVLAAAVVKDTFVAGFAPKRAFRHLLPYVLGKKKPRKTLKAAKLRELAREHRLLPRAVGFLDTVGLARMLLGKARGEHRKVAAALRPGKKRPPKVCRKEILSLAAKLPRVVFGYERLDTKRLDMAYVFELTKDLVTELRGLRSPVPGLETHPDKGPLATLGFGFKPIKAVELLRRRTKALVNRPFKCKDLAELNRAARTIYTAVATPMPTVVTSLNGAVLKIEEIDMPSFGPTGGEAPTVKATCVIASDKPEDLVTLFASFTPELRGVVLPPDGKPVTIAPGTLIPGDAPVFLARTAEALAFSTGLDSEVALTTLLNAPAPQAPPLLSLSYAAGRLAQLSLDASKKAREAHGQDDPAAREMNATMEQMGRLWKVFEHESLAVLVEERGLRVMARMWLGE